MEPLPTTLLKPAAHPILPVPSEADVEEMLATREGAAAYTDWYNRHHRLLVEATEDPLYRGLELDCWQAADEQLADPDLDIQVNFGWNRGGGKTWRALKRLCEAARAYPASGAAGYLVLGETEDSNKFVQMPVVWEFLKKYIVHLNGKQGGRYRVNFKPGTGFTEGVLVMPAGPIFDSSGAIVGYEGESTIWFDTYKGDPGKYEGREFGARLPVSHYTTSGKPVLMLKRRPGTVAPLSPALSPRRGEGVDAGGGAVPDTGLIQNVGAVADESLTLNWFRMLARRAPFRHAKVVWAFTPIHGITPAVKEVVGELRVETSAPAKLLPQVRVPNCKVGEMPVTGSCSWPRAKAVYFHISEQAFHGYHQTVVEMCRGRESEYVERMAYGYSRDSVARQFGNFGLWNIVKLEDLPADGTDYQIVDPGEDKPYFCIWVRVTRGEKPDFYVWRDWPDAQSFGEWAVATERETTEESRRGWDGDPGPAQNNMNLGFAGYKRIWSEIETVRGLPGGAGDIGLELDPKRRAMQVKLPDARAVQRMKICERIIDSRAGPRKVLSDHGQTCPVWQFAENHVDQVTGAPLGPIEFRLASGAYIDLGLVRDLLELRRDTEGRIERPPRLYVAENCKQVIWALENYTGKSGEVGASKDPIDCLRYMASAELLYVDSKTLGSRGGGSY